MKNREKIKALRKLVKLTKKGLKEFPEDTYLKISLTQFTKLLKKEHEWK